MKFTVTFKDPDGPYESIREAAANSLKGIKGLSADERESLLETRIEELNEACSKWFSYSEYVSIEIDTEADTATVLKDE